MSISAFSTESNFEFAVFHVFLMQKMYPQHKSFPKVILFPQNLSMPVVYSYFYFAILLILLNLCYATLLLGSWFTSYWSLGSYDERKGSAYNFCSNCCADL